MRVLTQNVLAPDHHGWDRRREALAAGIRALAPDVVALQEVVDVPDLLGPGWHEVWHSRRGDGGDRGPRSPAVGRSARCTRSTGG